VVCASGIEQLLNVGHSLYTTRSDAAIRLHQIEDQKRRRFGVDVHRLKLGYWRRLHRRPFGGDVVGLYGPRGKRGKDGEECGSSAATQCEILHDALQNSRRQPTTVPSIRGSSYSIFGLHLYAIEEASCPGDCSDNWQISWRRLLASWVSATSPTM